MDAYIDALELTITQAARRRHRDRAKAARPRRFLRLATAGGAVMLIAAVVLAVSLQGGKAGRADAAALPAFSGAASDITDRARNLPPSVSKGFDLRHARTFPTSKGTGYAVAASDGASVCVVVPDPPTGYGGTCAPVAEVKRRGLVAERVAPAADAGRTEVVVLQAAGVPNPVLTDTSGNVRALDVHDGIATAIVARPGTLTVAGSAGRRSISVRPFEPQGEIVVDCGHGHFVKARTWRDTTPDRRASLCANG
jgi:hypothetical protein